MNCIKREDYFIKNSKYANHLNSSKTRLNILRCFPLNSSIFR